MAITYTEYFASNTTGSPLGGDVTSPTVTVTADDIITVGWVLEDDTAPDNVNNIQITNSGTALTWNNIANTGTSGSSCYVRAWWAKATSSTTFTVTVTADGTNAIFSSISVVVHTGADIYNPVPAGNVFSGKNVADVTQAITPSQNGSALWFIAGDWAATNTFAAITNCTIESSRHDGSHYSMCVIRPTTQPLTSSSAFTIGETDTGGDIAWIAFEVTQAFQYARPAADTSDGAWLGQDGGANLYSYIDETAASSADYIAVGDASTCQGTFSAVTSYGAGAVLFNYVVGGDAAGTVKVTLLADTSVVGQWTHASLATGPTSFSQTITGLLSGGTNLSWRFETT